jgi:thiamine pyrophosphokinase
MGKNQAQKRAWIFANGELSSPEALRALIAPSDYRVAADGGLHHLRRLGLEPDLVIGDLDSLEPAEIEQLEKDNVAVRRYPVHKDETDLELTVEAVLRAGYTRIFIAGALGGRLDMTLANIFLLALPELAGVDARLEDGVEEVFLIRPGAGEGSLIAGQPGDGVSLLPLGGAARGIRTDGLYYPLRGETLFPERTRGVSNLMVSPQARVSLDEGLLICIHTRQFPAGSPANKE